MSATTNRDDSRLRKIGPDGQQEAYRVLFDEERAKGLVRPVRQSYIHVSCGAVTHMSQADAEAYARDPAFYGATFCIPCGKHFRLIDEAGNAAFLWEPDGSPVGS